MSKEMIKFQVSAPGRIILHGEHATLYGNSVLAAGLNIRTLLKFCELTDDSGSVKIELPDIKLSLELPLQGIRSFFSGEGFDLLVTDKNMFHKHVQYFITLCGLWYTHPQRFSLQMFIYLLICIAHNEELDIKPFHVYLSTELAICANLGSSSSFAVCLAACFLHWARLQKGDHDEFDVDDLDKIANYAIDCEEILPNYMFGLDPLVCTHGLITRSQYGENSSAFIDVPRLRILLIDSKIRENKHEQMKRLAELKYGYPTVIKDIFNKIDNLSKTTYRALDEIRRGYEDGNFSLIRHMYTELQINVLRNQTMLHFLTLSHIQLEMICFIAHNFGLAAKLTGVGGGGFAYIILPPDISTEIITNLSTTLRERGFTVTMTSMSCSGVRLEKNEIICHSALEPVFVHPSYTSLNY